MNMEISLSLFTIGFQSDRQGKRDCSSNKDLSARRGVKLGAVLLPDGGIASQAIQGTDSTLHAFAGIATARLVGQSHFVSCLSIIRDCVH